MATTKLESSIAIRLHDKFSAGIQSAGVATESFGKKAVAVSNKINKAFSGIAGTLGTLGVSIGAVGTFKSLVDLDNRMARLGLTANASAKQINEWKRHIFEVAKMPDIKIGIDPIISGLEDVMAATGDYDFAKANTENIARLLQGSGANGGDVGKVFSEFAKNKFSPEDIQKTLDNMITQSDMGKFTFTEFASVAERLMATYSQGKIMTPESVTKMNAASQVLRSVSGSPEIMASTMEAAIRDFTDVEKINKFKKLGISIRDNATGEMRDFNDIMIDVAKAAEDFRKRDELNKIFGEQSRRALIAYQSEYAKNISRLLDLGNTTGTLSKKSATMANTLSASFKNLQTAFMSLADENVSGPMRRLIDLMNYFSEDSERIETAIKGVTAAFAGLAAVKLGAGIVSFVANLKSIKSGGIDIGGLTKATGGAGMPVYVTNWGGRGGAPNPAAPGGGKGVTAIPTGVTGLDPRSVNAANFSKGARTAGILTVATVGITQAVGAVQQVKSIEADPEKTEREKSKGKGAAIGSAVGTTVGTGAGVIAGAAVAGKVGAMIGTAIAPGIGTAIGGAIGLLGGAIVGYVGGKLGEKIGSDIGDYAGFKAEQKSLRGEVSAPGIENPQKIQAQKGHYEYAGVNGLPVWVEPQIPVEELPPQLARTRTETATFAPQKVEMEGQADMNVNVKITDERTAAVVTVSKNSIPNFRFNTGNAFDARLQP